MTAAAIENEWHRIRYSVCHNDPEAIREYIEEMLTCGIAQEERLGQDMTNLFNYLIAG